MLKTTGKNVIQESLEVMFVMQCASAQLQMAILSRDKVVRQNCTKKIAGVV